jgi:hypothetical protein
MTGPTLGALDEALTTAPVLPRDAAAVELARRYAALLDESSPLEAYRVPLTRLRRLVDRMGDERDKAAFGAMADALGRHSTASDLGPKLLAVLSALGMTVAGRAVRGASGASAVPDQLSELRARAEARRAGSAG